MIRTVLATAVFILLILSTAALSNPVTGHRQRIGLSGTGKIQGEIVKLQTKAGSFKAIFREHQRGKARGAVVLLHDQGSNANSNEVIRPLRLGLAESGWDTLSLQLPAAYRGNDAGAWQSRQTVINERLQAGLDWIEARKPPNRVIVALGDSGAIALTFAATRTPEQLQALVLVSSPLASAETGAVPPPLQQRELPILDLYAERDHPPVTATATERRNAAAKAGYEDYRQRVLIGAAAGFHSQEDSLIAAIRAWLANKIAAAAAGR